MEQAKPLGRAYLFMHIAIVLYGFTAILGKLIELPGISIVVYRMSLTLLSLCFFPGLLKRVLKMPRKAWRSISIIGLLMAVHWVTFFESIKQSNVSIALSVFASTAFFVSIIEPIVFKKRIKWFEMLLASLVIVGFGFIYDFAGERYFWGIVLALISAITIAFSSVFNKAALGDYQDVFAVTFIQFAAGVGILLLFFPIYLQFFPETQTIPSKMDWIYLLILALICTTLAYNLNMWALQYVSAYTTTLSINLEPIYGMLMAAFFFQENEELSLGFYLGAGIILLSVFLHPLLQRYLVFDSTRQDR